jgi:2-polyprenyl-6-methoxyphenol hydroxylase-like FAD-dependent oxidoreductase
MHIVIIGAGVAGLASGIGLARSGHSVTLLERDPAPGAADLEEAFSGWRRKGVPQVRQGHFVLGRATDMLKRHAPEVMSALASEGIVPASNPLLLLLKPEELEPGDELTPIPTRRIPFELTLRRIAEAEIGLEIKSGVTVAGLSVDTGSGLPRVRAVGIADGSALPADFVIDAGGRRSPVFDWLRSHGAKLPAERIEDCALTYYGRYFRAKEPIDPWALMQSTGGSRFIDHGAFPGDNGTFGVALAAPAWDREMRALRNVRAWDNAASLFPSIARWMSRDIAEPLTDVGVCSGHSNTLRPFLDEGLPTVLGVLPVGDALCTTDARLAWGMSLGLSTGFAAARAITDHAGDPGDAAIAYDDVVMDEVESCFRFASARSRLSIRRWRGESTDPMDRDEQHAKLISTIPSELVFSDPLILRAFFRMINLTITPNEVFEDTAILAKLQASRASRDRSVSESGPTRGDLIRVMSSASRDERHARAATM